LSPKTRSNVIGAFRSFVGWLNRRGDIRKIPEFPWPKVDEYQPRILSAEGQDALLLAIPEEERGIFLAMAHMGLRSGEARALDVSDYRDGRLSVTKAVKGRQLGAPIRGTKSGKRKLLPVSEDPACWIDRHVQREGRLEWAPLFRNPRTGGRWTSTPLERAWRRACEALGVEISMYEGCKHSFATDALRRGVPERHLQMFLGHADARSTRRYACMADSALVSVLRPRRRDRFVGDLSVAPKAAKKHQQFQEVVVEPAGIEPATS
jgi:integrase